MVKKPEPLIGLIRNNRWLTIINSATKREIISLLSPLKYFITTNLLYFRVNEDNLLLTLRAKTNTSQPVVALVYSIAYLNEQIELSLVSRT